jgi:hypothetical protein
LLRGQTNWLRLPLWCRGELLDASQGSCGSGCVDFLGVVVGAWAERVGAGDLVAIPVGSNASACGPPGYGGALIAAHFADAIDLPTLQEHQDRIRAGLADIDRRLAEHYEHHSGSRAFLGSSLRLLTDAHRMYAGSNDQQRRLANQAFYSKIPVTEDEQFQPVLAEPFASIAALLNENPNGEGTTANRVEHAQAACDSSGATREPTSTQPAGKAQREPTDTNDVKGSRMPT